MYVKLARIKRGLSQGELSKLAGVGVTSIVKIEKGLIGGIRFSILKRISIALNTPFEELFLKED